jgi:hypothetical protein
LLSNCRIDKEVNATSSTGCSVSLMSVEVDGTDSSENSGMLLNGGGRLDNFLITSLRLGAVGFIHNKNK